MKKVITYGTYDCLHYGHINLLKRAKELGDYLIVGVTSDEYDKVRGKLDISQPLLERIQAVKDTGLADEIIVEEYEGQKITDIKKYDVDIFTVGSDWVGYFDYLKEFCEVVYLPRTVGVSSTEIRVAKNKVIQLGIIGAKNPAERFIKEARCVKKIKPCLIWDEDRNKAQEVAARTGLEDCASREELLDRVEAVYIVGSIDRHYEWIMEALKKKCHVICEGPVFLREAEACKAFQFAEEQGVVLFEGIKTRFFPAFEHLQLLLKTGCIGNVKDIEVSFSQKLDEIDYGKLGKYQGSLYDLGGYIFLPIFQILGLEYEEKHIFTSKINEFDSFTKGVLKYKNAIASFKAGLGVKTEGNLLVTCEKGYVYVPAPWWKMDYFEIRYEDLRNFKRYFWEFKGEGFRYEILEFVRLINSNDSVTPKYMENEILAVAKILESFDNEEYQIF